MATGIREVIRRAGPVGTTYADIQRVTGRPFAEIAKVVDRGIDKGDLEVQRSMRLKRIRIRPARARGD